MKAEEVQELAAKTAHEVNRAYCVGLGDTSGVSWEEAPEWHRESCRKGVLGVMNENTPEQSHECWLREKLETGWKYGPVKDASKREHPCFVPYEDLPLDQRFKDMLFVTVVRGVLAHARSSNVQEFDL